MRKILVIGGAGYVGCVLVPALLKEGYEVRVLDKLLFGKEGLQPVLGQIELVIGDTRSVHTSVVEDMDAIIDLGGLSNDPTAEYNPEANHSINTAAVVRMASAAQKAGVKRYIYASSCSIYYTTTPDDLLRDEDYLVQPIAPYSLSKYNSEQELKKLASSCFCPIMLRKGTIYGQSPRMRYDLVVNTFVKDAYLHRRLTLHAGGRMWRPVIHIEDVVEAYKAALRVKEEDVRGQVINVLSDNFTVKQLAKEVRYALEKNQGIRVDLDIQEVGISRSYRVNGSHCKELLGFTPVHSIGEAVDVMWEALEMGNNPNEPIYYNIRWLELLCEMEKRIREMGGHVL